MGTEHANTSYCLLRTRGAEHGPAAASQLGYGAEGWDLGGCRVLGGSRCCPHSSGWPRACHLAGTCPSVPVPLVLPAPSPVPSSLPRSQLAARQGCRWARDFFFFCRALSDSPVGLLKHLVSLSRRHYELININSLFWYLLLPGALAWDFIYLFIFYYPSPPDGNGRVQAMPGGKLGEATGLGDHGVPVPILQGRWRWGRGKVSSLALERPDPGSPAGAGGTRDAAPWDANAKGPVPKAPVPRGAVP